MISNLLKDGITINPQTYKVLEIINRDGGVTHLTAQHYNIGCIRKQISIIRRSLNKEYKVIRLKHFDANGELYSRWSVVRSF